MWFLTFISWLATAVYFVVVIMSVRSIRGVDMSRREQPIFILLACLGLLAVLKIWAPLADKSKKPWLLVLGSMPAILLLVVAILKANPCVFSGCEEKKTETNINSPR